VLDTWFSSALWPFSTLGWPEETEDLRVYYPTSLMITGFDILFFWVARMIMMGLEATGNVPFREVYIHALVRDPEGQKMSKTRGNVVDPLEVTEKHGTDAVRMAMLLGAAPGTDIVLTEERILSARAFANKIWNAARFIFLNMERSGVEAWLPEESVCHRPEPVDAGHEGIPLEDRWIFSRLNSCADLVNRAIERYRYHEAAQLLWQFFWHEFCDWYLEIKKLRFRENSGLDPHWRNLLTVFEISLRLLHPVMPFLTEELWQRLGSGASRRPVSIALGLYPQYGIQVTDHPAERQMQLLQEMVTAARNLRADLGLNPKEQLEAVLYSAGSAAEVARKQLDAVQKLASLKLEVRAEPAPAETRGVKRSTTEFDLVLLVPVAQIEVLRMRLKKEIEQYGKLIANCRRQLADPKFLSGAPEHVVNSIRQKLGEYEAQLEKSSQALAALP
jgi:valyl-tRNA synthetase